MSRSPYAVTSALVVACPGCKAPIGKRCVAKAGYDMQHCHSTRRRLADEHRTREVNPKLLPPLEHEYLPAREPLPRRAPDLCPDDSHDKVKP